MRIKIKGYDGHEIELEIDTTVASEGYSAKDPTVMVVVGMAIDAYNATCNTDKTQ